jgi:hypothetical protein
MGKVLPLSALSLLSTFTDDDLLCVQSLDQDEFMTGIPSIDFDDQFASKDFFAPVSCRCAW